MSSQLLTELFWRELATRNLDCGRQSGWNPVITHLITTFRAFDPLVGQLKPLGPHQKNISRD